MKVEPPVEMKKRRRTRGICRSIGLLANDILFRLNLVTVVAVAAPEYLSLVGA